LFFEQVIRENLDLGRPDEVRLIFNRRKGRLPRGCFRTRVVTKDVTPSLNVYYKSTRIKQYHKENRALRTETTINNSYDFGVGKRLANLPRLREIGFAANRRLIEVERLSHDCILSEDTFQAINQPVALGRQRCSGLRFADQKAHALLHALIMFRQLPQGFRAADLREQLAGLSGQDRTSITQGAVTYQLRRLRLHGLIERIPGSFRYRVTDLGLRIALFFTRTYNRLLRPVLAAAIPALRAVTSPLQRAFHTLTAQIDATIHEARLTNPNLTRLGHVSVLKQG
jgi:DNA-binding transcriptional ArsR family regulator